MRFEAKVYPQKTVRFNGVGWEMVKHKDKKVLNDKFLIQNSKFISLTYDQVTFVDNTSWANVHTYIVQN
jgi:hypothetical protein